MAAKQLGTAWALLATAALHGAAIAWLRASGFNAISDDDFARVAIAQQFVSEPRLNPSGTSWLPFPFWLQGIHLGLFGLDLHTARLGGWLHSAFARSLVVLSAGWLGASPGWALAAGLLCAIAPSGVIAGATPVPEAYVAALCLFGVAASCQPKASVRIGGGLALTAAALSRYEAWPLAGLGALYFLRAPGAAWQRLVAALLSLTGPALWMLGGLYQHGSPLFFVKRVADYRRALGAGNADWLAPLANFPRQLLVCEPELMALVGLGLLLAWRLPFSTAERRLAWAACALVLFLTVGDLKDGAPTHHPERALLPAWFLLAVLGALRWQALLKGSNLPRQLQAAAMATPLLAFVVWQRDHLDAPRQYDNRSLEEDIGLRAQAFIHGEERVALDHPGYGYFAMTAALARPGLASPLNRRDPRSPQPDPFRSVQSLRESLRSAEAEWLVAQKCHLGVAASLGQVVTQNAEFSLLRVGTSAPVPAPMP